VVVCVLQDGLFQLNVLTVFLDPIFDPVLDIFRVVIFAIVLLYPLFGWFRPKGGDPITYGTETLEILFVLYDTFYFSTLSLSQ